MVAVQPFLPDIRSCKQCAEAPKVKLVQKKCLTCPTRGSMGISLYWLIDFFTRSPSRACRSMSFFSSSFSCSWRSRSPFVPSLSLRSRSLWSRSLSRLRSLSLRSRSLSRLRSLSLLRERLCLCLLCSLDRDRLRDRSLLFDRLRDLCFLKKYMVLQMHLHNMYTCIDICICLMITS